MLAALVGKAAERMRETTKSAGVVRSLGALLVVASTQGCTPSNIIGPLAHQEEERNHLLMRARAAGMSAESGKDSERRTEIL